MSWAGPASLIHVAWAGPVQDRHDAGWQEEGVDGVAVLDREGGDQDGLALGERPQDDLPVLGVVGQQEGEVAAGLHLVVAAEPLRYWPLIERALAEQEGSSDGVAFGVRIDRGPLLRAGLAGGRLELLLGIKPEFRTEEDDSFGRELTGAVSVDDEAVATAEFVSEIAGHGVKRGDPPVFQGFGKSSVDQAPPRPSRADTRGYSLLGFDIVSSSFGLLHGHLTWLRLEHRGQGLWGRYADAVVELARQRGLWGFQFMSTLPFWRRVAPRYGFEVAGSIEQPGGPDAVIYLRRVEAVAPAREGAQ